MASNRFRKVPMSELRGIWAAQKESGQTYNGCTSDALVARYGAGNVTYIPGEGWFVCKAAFVVALLESALNEGGD